jgi:hypothetical protein
MKARVSTLLAALLGSTALLAACGESDEDKAQSAVCDARADIDQQLDDLTSLDITSVSIDQVTDSLSAIRDDLATIADEQGDLEPERREQVERAGERFRSQLQRTAGDLVAGTTTGEEARANLRSALDDLAQTFRAAYAPLDCD